MKRTCPSCQAVTENDAARFCGSCGAPFAAPAAADEATVVTRAAAPATTPPPPETLEFTAVCASCGGANPPDTEICMLCGEEIPQENRRRRTAALGALGAGGAGGFAGGMIAGQGGGAMQGMAGAGEAMQGLGQSGAAGFGGLGQSGAGQGMSGLGQAAGQPMTGLGGATPGAGAPGMGAGGPSFGAPGSPASMGAPGAPAPPVSSGPPPSMGAGGPPSSFSPPASPPGSPAITPPSAPPSVSPPQGLPGIPGGPGAVVEGGRGVGGVIIKGVLTGVGVIGGAVVAGVVLGGILVFTGDPKPCVDRASTPTAAAATGVLQRWAQFTAAAAAGPATVSYDEQEATSRAVAYLNEKDVPLSNTQIYFCPSGRGQVKGQVNALGRDINILLEGRVDTSQNPPVIVVDEIKAGNLPSTVATTIVGNRLDRNNVKVLDFGVPISAVNVADGAVTIESPGP